MSWVEGNEVLEKYMTFSILLGTDLRNRIDTACPFILPNVSKKSNKQELRLFLSFVIEFAHSCTIYNMQWTFLYRRLE